MAARRTVLISAGLSLVAAVLLVVHAVLPQAGIDIVTVGLLLVAVLPWMGSVFQSLEVPGLLKIAYQLQEQRQEIQRQGERVEELAQRVEEGFRFLGRPIAPASQRTLDRRLDEFSAYLGGLGVRWERELPSIRTVEGPGTVAWYDPGTNELRASALAAEDPDLLLKEFCYFVFHGPLHQVNPALAREISQVPVPAAPGFATAALLSGLATYLPCSFNGDPRFARLSHLRHGLQPIPLPEHRRLPRGNGLSPHAPEDQRVLTVTEAGMVWAGAFWEQRELIGRHPLDPALVTTWLALAPQPAPPADAFFPRLLPALAAAGYPDDQLAAAAASRGLAPQEVSG